MVDYTLTPNKSLIKPNRGTYVDQWDEPINSDWDYVDRALGGTYTVGVQAVPANPVTLTNDQSRYQQIKVSNQTGIITIEIPLIEGSSTTAVGGLWIIDNSSNTFDVNITTLAPGTTTVTVKTLRRQVIFSNGSGVYFADDIRVTAGNGLSFVGNALGISAPVSVANGGTGFAGGFSDGQLLIGKTDGTLARATLTAGTNITIANSDGGITINSTASGGTSGLTSISLSGGTTGLTFTPSTLNSTATSTTLSGTVGVANGGTGATTFGPTGGFIKSSGTTAALSAVSSIDLSKDVGTSVLGIVNGGTGLSKFTAKDQAFYTTGTNTLTTGTLPILAGGTGTTTATGTGNLVLATSPSLTTPSMTSPTITGVDTEIQAPTVTGGAIYFDAATRYISIAGNTFGIFASGAVCSGTPSAFVVPGSMTAASYATSSDIRIKKDIQPYNKSIDALNSLSPVTYKYNGQYGTIDNGVTYVGLIAQDVQNSQMSEMVTSRVYKDPTTGQETVIYGISQNDILFALINAVQDLDARVKALEAKVGPS